MADDVQGQTKVIRIVIDSSKAVDGGREAQRALENIEKQTAATANSVARMESGFDMVALVSKLTGSFYAVKEFTDRIFGIFKAARDAASGISDFAEQLGVSTDFVQGSTFAAASHTVSIDKLGQGYTKASQLIGQAAQGQKAAIDVFDQMGVKLLNNAGKLRSTELILSDSAAAILRIDDPARRVAAAMDLFGKSGAQLIPMLGDLASGADTMASKAKQAGALIEQETIESLSKLKAQSEVTSQKWTALVATLGAPIATRGLENLNKFLSDVIDKIERANGSWARFFQLSLEASQKSGPGNWVRSATPQELAEMREDRLKAELAKADPNDPNSRYGMISDDLAQLRNAELDRQMAGQVFIQDDEARARLVKLGTVEPPGARQAAVVDKAAGESAAAKYTKLIATLDATLKAQDAMTAAAQRGDLAFQQQTAHAEALQKAIDIYGAQISETDPKVAALEDKLQRIATGKAAQAFATQTVELEKQNTILEAQIRLMNEAPEVQAREIALIKARSDAQKAGIGEDDARYKRLVDAYDAGERLKQQAEQLRQAQQLWTEPLAQALRNIQTTSADAFDQMLQNGNISFQSLGQSFTATIRRMAAEFLALATVRPVMSVLVQGLGSAGLVSPAMASQIGMPLSGPLGMPGTSGGGGFGLGLPGGGGGGMFGFLNEPIFSSPATALPANVPYIPGVEPTLAASGSIGNSGAGGLTWGGALGGAASLFSIGMGVNSLMNARSAGGIIGGAGGIIGGGLGLASLLPGMSALGPWGAGIGIGAMVLSSLLGDGGPKIPPMPGLVYGAGGFYGNGQGGLTTYSGNQLGGGQSLESTAGAIGNSVLSLFSRAGLKVDNSKFIGGEIEYGTGHTWNGQSWQDAPYTYTSLRPPELNGGIERLTSMNSMDVQTAAEYLLTQVFKANVLRGGVSGASDSLKTALTTANPTTSDALSTLVDFTTAFDKLGKAANPVKDAIDKLGQTFGDMASKAQGYGLSIDTINAEQEKQTKRTAQDFIDNMLDPLAVQMRALDDERDAALASAQYIKDNVTDVYVDMAKVAEYYTNKEAQLRDQFYQGSVENLQTLINRMTYGDLAAASPDTTLAGTRAAYNADLAQARANDPTAIGNLGNYAEAYANAIRTNFASSAEAQELIAGIRRDLEEVVGAVTGGGSVDGATAANLNQASQTLVAANDQLREIVTEQSGQIDDLKNMVSSLVAKLSSQATNRM